MVTLGTKTECTEHFVERFKALTGNAPFPWQRELFLRFVFAGFPADVSLPTGTGKTSIMAIWLLALTEKLSVDTRQNAIPRRLIWVVNRRVVVDQATSEVEHLRRSLNDPAIVELEPVRDALRQLSANNSDEILGISTLRGQFEDNAEWRGDPSRPAVIVGTVDMIGSRLLFSGYGTGFKSKPLHAGFLGQDALLVHDEAHLEPAFQELIIAIQGEQKRCGDFGKFHVMALSATSRAKGDAFGLTPEEKCPPDEIPDSPAKPVDVIWRRQKAKKTIQWHENKDEGKLANEIADLALALEKKFKDSGCAVLVFVRTVEGVNKVVKKLPKDQTRQLTGTMRGFERDKLVSDDAAFRRFLPDAKSDGTTVYLVCTSAGEVGVNISADHLICDLSTFDSMVQRFGRVNRFGNRTDTEIHIFSPAEFKKDNDLDDRRQKTLELLEKLPGGEANPKTLGELNAEDCLAAFTPTPRILPATDILFDSWSLTTIWGKLPGRPAVEPYLHGISEYEPPETHVAWREEVGVIKNGLLKQYDPEELLDAYPLKPHELLRDRSDRVLKELKNIAERHPEAPVWLLADDGSIETFTLEKLAKDQKKDRIENSTILLSPSVGGLRNGSLDGDSNTAAENITNDVADEWRDQNGTRRRVRVWDGDDAQFAKEIKGMRLILTIDTDPVEDQELEEEEVAGRRYWSWYELPKSADNDGSKSAAKPVLWQVHTDDVVGNATRIIEHLSLPEEIRGAIVVAARFHDLGKKRQVFQRILGNWDNNLLLAKSGKKILPYSLSKNFRHEFASLLDARKETEFDALSQDMKELVLHLIAAHHGRGRPHFPAEEAYDPEATEENNSTVATQVPQRFARLQRKYGRWGLAYLESLLRAADYAASTNPSAFWDGEQ